MLLQVGDVVTNPITKNEALILEILSRDTLESFLEVKELGNILILEESDGKLYQVYDCEIK